MARTFTVNEFSCIFILRYELKSSTLILQLGITTIIPFVSNSLFKFSNVNRVYSS